MMEEVIVTPIKNVRKDQQSSSITSIIYKTPLKQRISSKNQAVHQEDMEAMTVLSNNFTPPSGITKFIATNPFDVELTNRLHLSVISPTIFRKISPKAQNSPFSWTIDEIARMKPAKFDEFPIQQTHSSDPELELKAQEAINKFFYENQIHPSPWNDKKEPLKPLITMTPTGPNSTLNTIGEIKKSKRSCWTQTTLSLPLNLPDHVEEALKPYFTFSQDQQIDDNCDDSGNASNNSLRRKLFSNNDDSVDDENDCSFILSPITKTFSPPRSGMFIHGTPLRRFSANMQRNHDMPLKKSSKMLLSPNISPIRHMSTDNISCQSNHSRGRLAMQLDFNGHMSVDMSFTKEKESDFQTLDKCPASSCDEVKTSEKLGNESQCSNNNDTIEMVSLSQEITPLKDSTNRNESILNKLKNAADWYKNNSEESYKLRRNITSVGNCENSSAFTFTQDTGYQTYSINNTTNNVHNRSTTPLKKVFNCDDRYNGMTPISEIKLSDWQQNIESMFSSTPSKCVRRKTNY